MVGLERMRESCRRTKVEEETRGARDATEEERRQNAMLPPDFLDLMNDEGDEA